VVAGGEKGEEVVLKMRLGLFLFSFFFHRD
jgi:hypothetical protein